MKRQPTEWEKIFASEVTHEGLISKIHTDNSYSSIWKQTNNPTKKWEWAEDLE